jgi:hypothetical protein
MSHAVNESKQFARPAAVVLAATSEIVVQLGGKRPKKDTGVDGQVRADFNKEVGGTSFGNRVQLIVRVVGDGADRCTTSVEAYPVDPIGNRLRFGVLGEPARLVTGAFWQRLEARLVSTAG